MQKSFISGMLIGIMQGVEAVKKINHIMKGCVHISAIWVLHSKSNIYPTNMYVSRQGK